MHTFRKCFPPRVISHTSELGLSAAFRLDLTAVDPDDGKPWDFNNPAKSAKALLTVVNEKPYMLIGCPPCTPFSVLFASNVSRMDPAKRARVP